MSIAFRIYTTRDAAIICSPTMRLESTRQFRLNTLYIWLCLLKKLLKFRLINVISFYLSFRNAINNKHDGLILKNCVYSAALKDKQMILM